MTIKVPEVLDQAAADKLIRSLAEKANDLETRSAALADLNQSMTEEMEALKRRSPDKAVVSRYTGSDGKPLLRGYEVTASGQKIAIGAKTNEGIVVRAHGFLDDPNPQDDLQRELQALVDTRSICRTVQKGMRNSDTSVRVATPHLDAEILRLAQGLPEQLTRAFVDSSTSGQEWIPTDTLPELERAVKLEWDMMLPGFFPTRDVARDITIPLLTQTFVPYQHGVTGDDPGQIVKSSVTTSSTTTALKTIAGHTQIGEDAAEEAIVPAVQELREQMAFSLVAAIEDAMINSDTAGTHQDTGYSSGDWNPGSFWPAKLTGGSNGHLRAFLGLRANAIDNSSTIDRSTFSFATLLLDLANLDGPRRNDSLIFIGSKLGMAKNLYGLDQVADLSVFGQEAVNLQGAVRRIAGVGRVYESVFATDDLNNNGIFDNSTTDKTAAHLVNVNRWRIWRRYGFRLAMQLDPTRGIWEMVGKSRLDFKALVSDEKSVRSMIKMAKS